MASPLDSLTRRAALAGAGAGALGLTMAAVGIRRDDPPPPDPAGLRHHAARKGLSFGIAVEQGDLRDAEAARLIAREADMLVPVVALKWGMTERAPGRNDWRVAEEIAGFARTRRLALRGHAAFWYRNLPKWIEPQLAGADPRPLLLRRTHDCVRQFRGRITEWDVLNEVIEPKDGLPGGLRRAPFGRAVDPGLFADCFHTAHAADPAAVLFYNDYAIETDTPAAEAKRRAVLDLLVAMKKRGAPVGGLGIQSHLMIGQPFDEGRFAAFLREVAALGLVIRLTELDVNDKFSRGTPARRDAVAADEVRRFLDVALHEPAPRGVLVWGVRPRDSWLQTTDWTRRADGSAQRPLPFADDLSRTPMWTAIARAFDGAPARG